MKVKIGKIIKEEIFKMQKKMTKEELENYYKIVKTSSHLFKDKTKYSRKKKYKERLGSSNYE